MRVRVSARPHFLALVLVSGVSPFATDTYLAALPAVGADLHASAGAAQLTMTAFILGFAAGQLALAPLSDALGRRPVLVASAAAFAVLSAVAGIAPGIGLLIAARALQGLVGGCCAAVGRAVVSDQHTGVEAAARYGALAAVTLLAPVLAPAIGGAMLLVFDWRSVFVFLAALGVVMALAVLLGIPETLPAAARSSPHLGAVARRMGGLLRQPAFATAVAVQCLATAGFFAYIGGSSFVLETQLHLSPSRYTLLFASNAAGMAAASSVFRAAVRRVGPAPLRAAGIGVSTVSAVLLALYAATAGDREHLAPVWVLLALTVAGMGLSIPGTTAIAQDVGRATGGTASALQGGLTFAVGALSTPLTGLTGQQSVGGLAAVMAALFVLAAGLLVLTGRRGAVPRAGALPG